MIHKPAACVAHGISFRAVYNTVLPRFPVQMHTSRRFILQLDSMNDDFELLYPPPYNPTYHTISL